MKIEKFIDSGQHYIPRNFLRKIRITRQNTVLPKIVNILNYWSMAQAGSNVEKMGSKISLTVPLNWLPFKHETQKGLL